MSLGSKVNKGMRWLDANEPGWRDEVDIEKLDMVTGNACVLGQVFADDAEGNPLIFNGYHYAIMFLSIDMEAHGFTLTDGSDFADLTRAWREKLSA